MRNLLLLFYSKHFLPKRHHCETKTTVSICLLIGADYKSVESIHLCVYVLFLFVKRKQEKEKEHLLLALFHSKYSQGK